MGRRWIARGPGGPRSWELIDVETPPPGPGEVTIRVRAAGMNPADAKHVAVENGQAWPVAIGYEVSGEISAIGPDTEIGSGGAAIGAEVVAFRVSGGYADELTVDASKVFRKPSTLTHPEAANLLLTGTTAAEMLAVAGAEAGDTVLLHGASGAVGVSVLQQAAARGIHVIGTVNPRSEASAERVRRFGGIPVAYGPGLRERVVEAAAGAPVRAALDAVGTDEAVDVSLALVADRARIVTIVARGRAENEGFHWIAGSRPDSTRFRDAVRADLIAATEAGTLTVPVAQTFALEEAPSATEALAEGHPGGAFALIP